MSKISQKNRRIDMLGFNHTLNYITFKDSVVGHRRLHSICELTIKDQVFTNLPASFTKARSVILSNPTFIPCGTQVAM